jgi:hypothetical protein
MPGPVRPNHSCSTSNCSNVAHVSYFKSGVNSAGGNAHLQGKTMGESDVLKSLIFFSSLPLIFSFVENER